ncbi:MAG: SapC family protein [Pseudomonadota bacterium]
MPKHVQLNSVEHKDIRVITKRDASLGDAIMAAPLFPQEFREAQALYPIVFSKEQKTGKFRPYSLFGLEEGENLFLDNDGWNGHYLPLAVRMQPFLIGFAGKPGPDTPMEVHIDIDHARVGTQEGEALFHDHGGETDFLKEIASLLGAIDDAEQTIPAFSAMLNEFELIEPFTLDITLDNGAQGRLAGYYTIAEERLQQLAASELDRLQRAGMLQPIYMAVASLSQFVSLIRKKNQQLARSRS